MPEQDEHGPWEDYPSAMASEHGPWEDYPAVSQSIQQPSGQQGISELVSPSGSLAGDVNVLGRVAKIGTGAAKDIGLTGGADPFGDLLRTAGQQTGIPFLESADKVNQALGTLQLAKKMHEALQGLRGQPSPSQLEDKQIEQPKEQADLEAEAELKAAARKPETTPIWQAFQGDIGLNKLVDHVIAMEGDSRSARENNNPGNLKDPKTDGFMQFGSYEEGRQALLKQLSRWRDKNPDWSIADFNRNYAPDRSHGGDNPEGTEAGRNQHLMNAVMSAQAPASQAEVQPPPGFIIEPKPEDFSALQQAAEYLKPAAKVIGGMATTAAKVSTPYIAWQIYKKFTGQPNELAKIPGNAIKTFGLALVGGPEETTGESAAPEPPPAQAPRQAPVTPRQLPMPVMEGEYMSPPSAGALPPGQYAQPAVQQQTLPPGQYAPAAPPTRLALPEKASAIPLPETFPEARQPIIRTTPSEPLEPLTTREEPAAAKSKPPKTKAKAKPAVVEAKAPAVAERTAVGTEGEVKGMRLVQRGNKWYDAKTGEEYQWKTRRGT